MRLPQPHDGPAPLNVRGHGALPRSFNLQPSAFNACLWHEKGGGSNTSQSQTTTTTDNRVATDGDGNQIYHGNEIGGSVILNTLADDVAVAALDTAAALGSDALGTAAGLGRDALDTADRLGSRSFDTADRLGSNALDTAADFNRTGADTVTQLAAGALEGLKSLLDSNARTSTEAFSLVSDASANSAAGARQVADSQKEFLRAQTGQDTVVKIIGYGLATLAVGGVALAVATSRKSK
jgi:hypothetical protein